MHHRPLWLVALAGLLTAACSSPDAETVEAVEQSAWPEDVPPILEPWKGDLGGMVERRVVRALVVYNQTNYFFDGADQKGITYEALQQFEKVLNDTLQRGHLKVHVLMVPVARDQLISGLVSGRGDLAAASLTITPERGEQVDFSDPFASNIDEIVVTGPASPELTDLQDLSSQEVYVRRSSSYFSSLEKLNEELRAAGKEEAELVPIDEYLEDEDLLQMVHAGLIPTIVVDSYKAELWANVFEDLELHHDLVLRAGGEIGWAFRKESPELAAVVNAFVKTHKKGTLMGNILLKRYYGNTEWVKNAASPSEITKLHPMLHLFEKYGREYDFDPLILAAVGYQESRLDQSVRSAAGAVGVMQLLPSTARDPNVGISGIDELENNVHAGTKYLDFLRRRYFDIDEMTPQNKAFFTLASYNAGPAKVRGLRERARAAGLDPNVWFDNVEVIAAREIGRETVQYVANIAKYYLAYERAVAHQAEKEEARPPVS